jgi:hypothetical protein
VVEHALAKLVFGDVNLRVVLQRNCPVPGLDPVCRVHQYLGNGVIFLPTIFPKTDCPRVNGEGEKRHGKNPYFGGRNFVGPPILRFGGFGAGGGGTNRLIGRDAGDDFEDPDFDILYSFQRW